MPYRYKATALIGGRGQPEDRGVQIGFRKRSVRFSPRWGIGVRDSICGHNVFTL